MSEPTMAEQLKQERLEQVADPAGGILEDAAIIAARNGWAYARCGELCGFVATGPDADVIATILANHRCGLPQPEPNRSPLARLVVGCATFIAVLILILLVVEDLAGVK